MELKTTIIYEMALRCYGRKWREEIENDSYFATLKNELKEQILPKLDEETAELLNRFELRLDDYLGEIHYFLGVKMFSLAVELGMQLQQAFDLRDE